MPCFGTTMVQLLELWVEFHGLQMINFGKTELREHTCCKFLLMLLTLFIALLTISLAPQLNRLSRTFIVVSFVQFVDSAQQDA